MLLTPRTVTVSAFQWFYGGLPISVPLGMQLYSFPAGIHRHQRQLHWVHMVYVLCCIIGTLVCMRLYDCPTNVCRKYHQIPWQVERNEQWRGNTDSTAFLNKRFSVFILHCELMILEVSLAGYLLSSHGSLYRNDIEWKLVCKYTRLTEWLSFAGYPSQPCNSLYKPGWSQSWSDLLGSVSSL